MNESNDIDPMAHMDSDLDDLGNLFEFGDIDLNNIPDTDEYGNNLQQQHGTHPNTPFQDMSEPPPIPGTTAGDFHMHSQFGLQQASHHQHFVSAPLETTTAAYTTEPMYQASMQQMYHSHPSSYQVPPQPGGFPHNHVVPPTPNSFEMHGETGRLMPQHPHLDPQQRAILEQRYHLRKDDAIAFTPIMSPAGTPQYHMVPEFTTPGAYFSPLTSPMLHAQNQHHAQMQQQQQQGYITNPSTAPSSTTNTPIDPALDIHMATQRPGSADLPPRKSRKKTATSRSVTATSNPISSRKSQKRKTTASSNMEDLSLRATQPQLAAAVPPQMDSSEAESISPEPLSESLMGPPPRPGSSLNQSPALVPQQQQNDTGAAAPAATPKSLLTMRSSQQRNSGDSQRSAQSAPEPGGIDDLSLPEAATTKQGSRRPSLTQINTQISLEGETPRLSARKTPKLGPQSTPAGRPGSALQSPTTIGSPMAASTPSAILQSKNDGKGGRGGKKRGSISAGGSKMVSPALVPKRSPSIKPLLPEGTPLNTATQAMLLASKSNYQNLLEGNHLPGVSYPDSLQSGLTSKKASHKVAEQGRRNRINEALKEMQSLIPKPSPSGKSPSSAQKDSAGLEGAADTASPGDEDKTPADAGGAAKEAESVAKSNSSKAATVELANEYIKKMQKDSASTATEVLLLRRENEELKRRLAEQSGQSPADSSTTSSPPPAAVKVK